MLTFNTDYIFLLGALCILIGFLYAFFLYFKNCDAPVYLKRILFFLRLLLVTIIAFLLLNPLIKTISREYEKPIVIIAQDVSESVQSDSIYSSVRMLADNFSSDFEVFPFHFSENLNEGFIRKNLGKITNYSKPINLIYDQFFKQNVAAVILATDGIYNYGSNPLYSDKLSDFPYYTIAYGDTVQKKDIGIEKVRHNDIAFLGNVTTLKIDITGHGFKGKKTKLNIFHEKELIQSTEISFLDDKDFQSLELALEVKKIGLQKYTITLDSLPLDYTSNNNRYDIFIEVIDSRYKVLLLVDGIHPDIAAFKSVIETNKQLNIVVEKLSEFEGNLGSYHLVVCAGFDTENSSVIRV